MYFMTHEQLNMNHMNEWMMEFEYRTLLLSHVIDNVRLNVVVVCHISCRFLNNNAIANRRIENRENLDLGSFRNR